MSKQLRFSGYEFTDHWRDALDLAARVCHKHKRVKLFFATFLSDSPAHAVLRKSTLPITLSKRKNYWVGSLRSINEDKSAQLQFGIFNSGEHAWTAFALTETIVKENILLKLFRLLAPDFSKAYLTSMDIRHMFEHLEEAHGAEAFVNKAIAYSHRREGVISFKKEPYHQVFNRAESEKSFIDKVDFTLGSPRLLHAFVSRNGVTKFIEGDIRFFVENILTAIVNTASGKHQVFRQSSRKPGEVAVSPIDLEFGQAVFQERNDNLSFLSALDLMSRSGIAVLHENPYVHVSLIDFFDGSSFDIFATTPSAVTIIPQVGASAFSLNRLCNHIFENFREGMISKPQPRRWTLEDVLA